APVQTITCPVNTEGAMGAGLALKFREVVPGLYTAYRNACRSGELNPTKLWVYPWPGRNQQVLCFPTKIKWRNFSSPDMLHRNLLRLVRDYEDLGITSLAIPPLGAGLGGLEYQSQVRDMVFEVLDDLPFEVRVCFGYNNFRI